MDVPIGLWRLLTAVQPWRAPLAFQRHGLTLATLTFLAARNHPAEVALIDDEGALTYGELARMAREHHTSGERIVVRELNDRSFVISVVAGLLHNADVVLADPRGPAVEVGKQRAGRRGQVVVMTSGSTGTPKVVERKLTPAQVMPITTLVRRLPLKHGVPLVVTQPLFHGFGLGFLALGLAFGMPVVVRRHFDPEQVAEFLQPGFVLTGVPPILSKVARTGVHVPLRAVVSGAGPLHPAVADRLTKAFGPVVFNLYGSSEDGWSTLATPEDLAEAPGTIGRAATGVRIAILDDEGRPVAPGEIGHVWIESSLQTRRGDSGDLGHRDSADRFFIDGRADDLIVTGGENVFPIEVENVLLTHPAVAEVRVVAVPDEEYGALPAARVVRRDAVQAEELINYARERLAPAKVPRQILFADDHV
ncbi:acyl-CoA synthetase (AMP-forming)/AMP-acid ligase II [Kribbella antiqua]|uniref:Acyl-CoA synthetase (AMP-forming)/AMP-acid ligase II n=1 Tax=Kribbella antiqua TaxID=2512217 RepID=A0A4R2IHX7_9ACTN|nr:AMP-binding protein [Kribbella antiqua]TCO44484.1 acyl-CoA synthetase (AMP-forming)/AMP-acid ligase II [Kribbella antiqua]